MILKVGVDGVAFRDIARAAHLTHGALYARFEDVEELLVDVWSHTLVPRAITLFETVSVAVTDPSQESVDAIMERLRHPTAEDTVMVKVLWTSRRYLVVREEVESFIHAYLENGPSEISEPLQSRTLTLFSLVLLAMFSSSLGTLESGDLACFEETILEALRIPTDDIERIEYGEPIFRALQLPKDDLKDQLVYHTFLAVGRSGYARSTISRISRRADCSPGAIYKIFNSKEDLVVGSVRAIMEAPWVRISTFASFLDPGKLAQLLYSAASPDNSVRKEFTLEVAMASAYNEGLRVAVQLRLRDIESVIPLIHGLTEEENRRFTAMIRLIIFCVMGVSYLSTVTKATDHIDFNQFAEPLRQSILKTLVPSWPDIRQQLERIASASKIQAPTV